MMSGRLRKSSKRMLAGFTLVELLVVAAVVSILVAMLMPAVQAARETARISHCKNNLKQMAVAFLNHEAAHGHLPTGGWGYKWIGDPDAGYGKNQPGGWAYNILAFIEQQDLRDLGAGISDRYKDPMNVQRQCALMQLVTTPLSLFSCPSKRPLDLWPYARDPVQHPFLANNVFSCSMSAGCRVTRGDYRVSSGSIHASDQMGPGLVQQPDTYSWGFAFPGAQNGICYQRSLVRIGQISDGTARTAMIGEKYLNPEHYFDGADGADDQCVYTGHDRDNAGYTRNVEDWMLPRQDERRVSLGFRFGSAHATGLNMAFCDGSAHHFSYDIDEGVWRYFGSRNDGAPM
jgi:prepilin-type N-terminal cleavage/methylation domain-containing protein/prepilin-type processing-associated H-X9-DG protein